MADQKLSSGVNLDRLREKLTAVTKQLADARKLEQETTAGLTRQQSVLQKQVGVTARTIAETKRSLAEVNKQVKDLTKAFDDAEKGSKDRRSYAQRRAAAERKASGLSDQIKGLYDQQKAVAEERLTLERQKVAVKENSKVWKEALESRQKLLSQEVDSATASYKEQQAEKARIDAEAESRRKKAEKDAEADRKKAEKQAEADRKKAEKDAEADRKKAERDKARAAKDEARAQREADRDHQRALQSHKREYGFILARKREGHRLTEQDKKAAEQHLEAVKEEISPQEYALLRRRGIRSGVVRGAQTREEMYEHARRYYAQGEIGRTAGRYAGAVVAGAALQPGGPLTTVGLLGGGLASLAGGGARRVGAGLQALGGAGLMSGNPLGMFLGGIGMLGGGILNHVGGAAGEMGRIAIPALMHMLQQDYDTYTRLAATSVGAAPFTSLANGDFSQGGRLGRMANQYALRPEELLRRASGFGSAAFRPGAGGSGDMLTGLVLEMSQRGVDVGAMGGLASAFRPGGGALTGGRNRDTAARSYLISAMEAGVAQGMEAAQVSEYLGQISQFTGQMAVRGVNFDPMAMTRMFAQMGTRQELQGGRGVSFAQNLDQMMVGASRFQGNPMFQHLMWSALLDEGLTPPDVMMRMSEGMGNPSNALLFQNALRGMNPMQAAMFGNLGLGVSPQQTMAFRDAQFGGGGGGGPFGMFGNMRGMRALAGLVRPGDDILRPQQTTAMTELTMAESGARIAPLVEEVQGSLMRLRTVFSENADGLAQTLGRMVGVIADFVEDMGGGGVGPYMPTPGSTNRVPVVSSNPMVFTDPSGGTFSNPSPHHPTRY